MGINTYLVTKLGEDKTSKLKAIFGALFIYILGNFPIATIVDGLNWNPIYRGYAMLVWSAFVIALTSIIILFFGKSDLFPIPATSTTVVIETDEPVSEIAEVIEAVEEVIPETEAPVEEVIAETVAPVKNLIE